MVFFLAMFYHFRACGQFGIPLVRTWLQLPVIISHIFKGKMSWWFCNVAIAQISFLHKIKQTVQHELKTCKVGVVAIYYFPLLCAGMVREFSSKSSTVVALDGAIKEDFVLFYIFSVFSGRRK